MEGFIKVEVFIKVEGFLLAVWGHSLSWRGQHGLQKCQADGCIVSANREMNAGTQLASSPFIFLFSSRFRSMEPSIVGLQPQLNFSGKHLHRHTQKCLTWVVPNPVKTVNINCHTICTYFDIIQSWFQGCNSASAYVVTSHILGEGEWSDLDLPWGQDPFLWSHPLVHLKMVPCLPCRTHWTHLEPRWESQGL